MLRKQLFRFITTTVLIIIVFMVYTVQAQQAEGTSDNFQVVNNQKEYQILKGVKDKEGYTPYIVRVLDDKETVIWEKSYMLTRDTISVSLMENDIVVCKIGVGTGLNYTRYYDRKNRRESPVYTTPMLTGHGKVVTPKRGMLVVTDMFDHKVFYKELPIEDLAPVANPVDGYVEIKWAGADKLAVTYLTGRKGEEYSPKTVVFDLKE